MSAQFSRVSDGVCSESSSDAPDESFTGKAFATLSGLMGRISTSHAYGVSVTAPPVIGRLGSRTYTACFAIDGSPWTIRETGQPLDKLKNLLGPVGKIGGAIFR
jgi:hypothetical protein